MDLLPYFEWIESSALGDIVRQSMWLFPVVQSLHLLGLSVLGGTVLIVDLRMLGTGLRNHPISRIAGDARPWFIGALVVMLLTGAALFASEAIKCYYNFSFWVKITTLPIAIAFIFFVRDRIAARAGNATPLTRAVGFLSIALWFTVAAAGRWIGFS